MNAKLYNQVEMAFWDLVIYALTESQFIRGFVRRVYHLMPGKTFQTALFAATVGLFSGFVVFIIVHKLFQG